MQRVNGLLCVLWFKVTEQHFSFLTSFKSQMSLRMFDLHAEYFSLAAEKKESILLQSLKFLNWSQHDDTKTFLPLACRCFAIAVYLNVLSAIKFTWKVLDINSFWSFDELKSITFWWWEAQPSPLQISAARLWHSWLDGSFFSGSH